jgi:hypothetical protein
MILEIAGNNLRGSGNSWKIVSESSYRLTNSDSGG